MLSVSKQDLTQDDQPHSLIYFFFRMKTKNFWVVSKGLLPMVGWIFIRFIPQEKSKA
jgi:hypothetical protein